ncbi:AsmA family protein [Xanthomarina spongicola]|uniref:DUF748 domain-containing protein n=1 Tax=Xanthomarina spongicola TaxID=570520 RepID=A0A316DPP7_9FLAO|nr:hypothetical protein [Xanthomarina spongicola]PWK19562.1 hypothetical protein LX78_00910 [Xanthomarina spongicola]
MGKQKSNWLKFFGIIAIILVLVVFIAQYVIKSKIERVLSTNLPETINVTYSDLHLSILKGKIEVEDIKLTNFGKTIKKPNAQINIEQLSINGLSYWNYLLSNLIQIDEIYLKNPNISYYHNPLIPNEEYLTSNKKSISKQIQIKEINIDKGHVLVMDSETDSLKFQTENIYLKLEKIVFNQETQTRKIPFDYDNYQINFDSFFGQLGDYECLTVKHGKLTKDATELTSLRLYTKYTKEKLSRIIPFERDHFNLRIDSVQVEKPHFGIIEDSIWQFSSNKVAFFKPDFNVYRDKLVADDKRIKPLYSKMLRNLKMDLTIDNVLIHDGDIIYSERVKVNRKAGEITFSKFNADIKNVSNTYQSPTKTTLNFDMLFMKHAPLEVVWSFDVNNLSDLFEFQAEIGLLQARYLNTFTEPNLNARLEGELDKTYFTISGTDDTSTIDFKVRYKDFDVTALKDNGKDKNKFLTDVAKLFVNKSSQSKKHPFKEAVKHNIERNKTKSAFNFIWISARAGLLKTMTVE